MKIKKFEAPSLPEALAKIKHEMGEAAVILKTRFNTGGPGKTKKSVEVTAAIDSAESRPVPLPIGDNSPMPEAGNTTMRIRPELDSIIEQRAEYSDLQTTGERLTEIKNEIETLGKSLQQTQADSLFGQPSGLQIEIARGLVEKGIPEKLAVSTAKRISPDLKYADIQAAWNEVIKLLASNLSAGEPVRLFEDKATVILLMGPTGGGKTSAAARLAFHHSVELNLPVTMFSTDTFRADSREQLKSLGDMIGCPTFNIGSPEQLAVALKSYRRGLIIIDTSGISNRRDLAELAPMVAAANPHETHLVVPADMAMVDICGITQALPDRQIDKILVTKLDQSRCRGGLFGAAWKCGLKFSYQGASREIPGRFGLFDPEFFVTAFLPEVEGKRKEADSLEVVGW